MTTEAIGKRRFMHQLAPVAFGIGCLIAVLALFEILIRAGFINRFIVPAPLDIAASFGRIIRDEHVGQRFLLTCYEALGASILLTVFGIAIGVLLHRMRLVRLATETWVAAMASAPLV